VIAISISLADKAVENSPQPAVVAKSQEGSFELTTSSRTNRCRLELRCYTKKQPYLQGFWVQGVFIGDKHLISIQHSATEKEQSMAIEQGTGYGVLQIDRSLDGKYEMLIVVSLKDQHLVDVLYVTDDGWLRHSTPEEFQARQHIAEGNRQAIEKADKVITDALKKANEELRK
jgi:hypothetical protein